MQLSVQNRENCQKKTKKSPKMDRYWYVEGTLEKHLWPENVTREYK